MVAFLSLRARLGQLLLLQAVILFGDYTDDVLHGHQELLVPAAHLFELFDAEIQELCFQLRWEHFLKISNIVTIITAKKVVEFKPKTHHLVIEVGAWL